jgi:hypothetical protein
LIIQLVHNLQSFNIFFLNGGLKQWPRKLALTFELSILCKTSSSDMEAFQSHYINSLDDIPSLQKQLKMVYYNRCSRLLKRKKWTRKELWRISLNHSKSLHQAYHDDRRRFTADDLVFLDELIFNGKTGWRYQLYAPISRGLNMMLNNKLRANRTFEITQSQQVQFVRGRRDFVGASKKKENSIES